MPWKSTVDRSGSSRLASPPAPAHRPAVPQPGLAAVRPARPPCAARRQRHQYQERRNGTHQEPIHSRPHQTSQKDSNYTRNLPPGLPRSRSSMPRNVGGNAMPPVRKMRMPSSTRDIGIDRALALADHDVAQIEMVGRHVHRHQRLAGPVPRSTVNSRVRKPSDVAAPRVLDQHHPLEPGLVVRRKRDRPAA